MATMAEPRPVDADAANRNYPAANTAAVVTLAAVTGQRHHVTAIHYSYSAAPTGGGLTVEDPSGTVVFDTDVTGAGPGAVSFASPIRGEIGGAVVVTLKAGGAGITGKLQAYKYTE